MLYYCTICKKDAATEDVWRFGYAAGTCTCIRCYERQILRIRKHRPPFGARLANDIREALGANADVL